MLTYRIALFDIIDLIPLGLKQCLEEAVKL
jgi:hypothetical protein